MKKTKLTRSLLAACSIVALSAVMYGCVHSGGDDAPAEPVVDMPEPMPTPAELLAAAQTALADAQAAVDAAVTAEQISAAYAALATAQAQVAAAAALPENQIAALNDSLRQLRMDLKAAQMLAGQRDTVGTALRAAQSAVNGLSNDSSDEDVAAAAAAVMDAQDALAAATALPDDDALRTSVAAVDTALDTAKAARTVHMQQGTVTAAVTTARTAVDGLSNTSSDEDVAAARTAVMDAQDALGAADALAAEDPLHALVTGVYSDLGTAVNARTAHTETGAINGLISAAMTAVDALNQVNSSVQAVSDAHTAVQAAADLIAAATQADTAALTAKLAADAGDALTTIVTFRTSPAGSLEVANAALTHANTLVAGLTSDSTADDARAAYQALADAQVAVRIAEAHPENQIANLNQQLTNVRNQLTDTQTATAAVVAATTALAGLNNDSDESDVQDARTAVDAAQTALDGATNVSAEDMASLQGAIDSLENTLSPIEMAVAARPDPAVVAANTAAAMTKTTAIGMEAGQTPDAGLGGNDGRGPDGQPGGTDDTYSLTIERPRAGTEITIADSMNPADADPATPQFAQAMDLGESNGFARTMHRRVNSEDDDGGSVEEVVIVATDIDPPTETPFDDVHTLDFSTDTENDDPDDTFEALAIDETDDDVVARVMSAAFVSGGGSETEHTFDEDDTSTADEDEAFETSGTYDGAMGTYRCNGTAECTVTLDMDGMITAMSDGWIFTPADDEMVDVPDANFLSYGVWLQRTKDEDGVVTSYDEVETFTMANGHPETGDSDLGEVEGTATYTGGATGVYVKNVLDDQGNITSATSGQFKAAVTLNASFGGGNVAANDQFTIGGSITGFDLEHDEENDWEVSLGLTDLSGGRADDGNPGESGPGSSHNNVFSGVATGDSTAAAGTYNGTFYGSSADVDHDMDAATPQINPQPVAVLGEFNANFTDGTTAGAYGADRE